jgi:hypothetical protein
MDPILKRFKPRITRGWALLLLFAGAVTAAAFWIGPLRAVPAELRLYARADDGAFAERVAFDASAAKRDPAAGGAPRLPLLLGITNAGARPARPAALFLSVPATFRLLDAAGEPFPSTREVGNPLVRYRIDLEPSTVEPGPAVRPLGVADTLWLEPVLRDYYCTFGPEGVPDFVAAPERDPAVISHVEIFYSFSAATVARQAGLLTVMVEPSLLVHEAAPQPPAFPATVVEPAAARPPMAGLVEVGSRIANCGDDDQDDELHTVLWETPTGGRFFVVYHGGVPRKQLFDLDRDGVIELEMWDPDADGDFEARRAARLRTPSFLLPAGVAAAGATQAARVPAADSAWLRVFYDVGAGPFRFVRPPDTPADTATTPAIGAGPPARTGAGIDTLRDRQP